MQPTLIDEILKDDDYNIKTYTLHISDETPQLCSFQMNEMIKSNPSLVVMGITYRSVTDSTAKDERLLQSSWIFGTNQDIIKLYDGDDVGNRLNLTGYYKRGYFIKGLIPYIKSIRDKNYFKKEAYKHATESCPLDFLEEVDKKKNYPEIVKKSNDPNDVWRPIVTNESTRYKEALIYNVKTLQDAGIPVIIINMPIHPLFSEKITDESRQNFFDLLNQTGAVWYDMERDYGDEFFRDSHHASFYGAHQFAPVMADLIIEQVEQGVIHYS